MATRQSALQHLTKQDLLERHYIVLSLVGLNVMVPSMFQQKNILKIFIF